MIRIKSLLKHFISLAVISVVSATVQAANTSGVHGPVIDPDDKSFMFRSSFVPGDDGEQDASAIRLHYQQAISEEYRWRVISQFRGRDSDYEYDYVRAELLWYLTPGRGGDYDTAVRFDLRTRKGDRPETFAIQWTNQWKFKQRWQARGILVGYWDFGGTAVGGTQMETRASLLYKLDSGQKVGIEMFSDYGHVTEMGSWDSQEHQLGPVISGNWGETKYQLGYLAGVSSSADDHDFRFWLSRKF